MKNMSKFEKIKKVAEVVMHHDSKLTKFQAAEIAEGLLEKRWWDLHDALTSANHPYKIAGRAIFG